MILFIFISLYGGCDLSANLAIYDYLTINSMKENFLQLFSNQTPQMFYILGLIFGDGCVHFNTKTRKYYVNLTCEDLDILENFRSFIGNQYSIKSIKTSKASKINVWSKPLCEALFQLYGLKNKKSDRLIYPNIPVELEKFFVIGLHATDGSNPILTIKSKHNGKTYINKTLEWNYTSCSLDFIKKINEVVSRNTGLEPAKLNIRYHKTGNTSYSIRYHGKKAQVVCDWMYDCPEFMRCKRKYQMYQSYLILRDYILHPQVSIVTSHLDEAQTSL